MRALIPLVEREQLANFCGELLASNALKRMGDDLFERYRQMPMTDALEDMLSVL
jgi:hypothetical protein